MPSVCILTDSAAHFPTRSFPGQERVRVMPVKVCLPEQADLESTTVKASHFPPSANGAPIPTVEIPSVKTFQRVFRNLETQYDQIIGIFTSAHLNPTATHAQQATQLFGLKASVEVIDSHTTGPGLGLIVQAAAEAAAAGLSGSEIRKHILGVIPHIYSVFCIRGLTYLHKSGYLDTAQAQVGELLGVTPLYILERGRLTPTQKIRSSRHMVDCLYEFVSEFERLKHIGFLQGVPPYSQEKRALRERLVDDFPDTPISEHTINPVLASVLGPQTLGVFLWEQVEG